MTLENHIAGMSKPEAYQYFIAERKRLELQLQAIRQEIAEVDKRLAQIKGAPNG